MSKLKQVVPTSASVSATQMDRHMDDVLKRVRATVNEKRTARQAVRKVIERLRREDVQLVPASK